MSASMRMYGLPKRGILSLALLALMLFLSLASALAPMPAKAQVSIAITGSFYSHVFEIPRGSSMSGPGIYVIVSNLGSEEFETTMRYEVPEGVTISFSHGQFVMPPGTQQKVLVRVEVGPDVVADSYPDGLKVIAEAYRPNTPGLQPMGSAAQVASLTVSGESASVVVNTAGTDGQPVTGVTIRLFRVVDGRNYEVAYSSGTGTLEAKVVPGDYVAEAYSSSTGEPMCDPVTFAVAADELKTVTLTVQRAISFQGFAVNPQDDADTGKLAYAQIVYTIANLYQEMNNTQVKMVVSLNGVELQTLSVLPPITLPLGSTPGLYNYVSTDGWQKGLYGFKLQLYVGDRVWAETAEETIRVGPAGVASWLWIIFVILGVLGTAGLGFLIFFLLKRRKKGEKPEKVEKKERKKKEEKPARKAEEPLPKPEPYRPAEHVRPAEPVRYEEPTVEPTVEPATLSSVSSLKARMASLGRDQGTGKVAEEEPDTEKKDELVETGPLASQPVPVPPPSKIEPERPAVKKVEEKGHKPPTSEKPAGHKPGIFSRVTATGKKEPPKPPGALGPAPVKPENEIQINWPPKSVEPPKPPSDVQINWPPKPVEPPKPSGLEEAARQRVEAQQHVGAPEEAAPEEEVPSEEPGESQRPPSRSSFAEVARLRMEARQRASETGKTGAGPEESQTEGDANGGSGEGENRPPSP
jgi:hypothetical protein